MISENKSYHLLHALSLRMKVVLLVYHVRQAEITDIVTVCVGHCAFLSVLLGQVNYSLCIYNVESC